MSFLFERLTQLILARPLATAAILGAVLAVAATGIVFLRADFSAHAFFGADDPELETLRTYQEEWHTDDLLMVVIEAPEGQTVLTRSRLQAVDAMTLALRDDADVTTAVGPTSVPRPGPVPGFTPPASILRSMPDVDDERFLAPWRASALGDAALVPALLSADGRYAAILVQLRVPSLDLSQIRPVVRRIDTELQQAAPADLVVRVAGIPALRARIFDVILADQSLFLPITGIGMIIALIALFRTTRGVSVPLLAALVPLIAMLGLMGYLGEPIGLLNQTLFALVPVISVADSIHLLSRFREEAQLRAPGARMLTGEVRTQAAMSTLGHLGVACFMTSLTTVVGFLSLNASSMEVLREYGTWAGIGIALAYLTTILILPLGLWWSRRAPPAQDTPTAPEHGLGGRLLAGCSRLALGHPWLVLAGATILVVVSIAGGRGVAADYHTSRALAADHPTTVGNVIIDENLGGLQALEFDLSGPPGTFDDPGVLRAVEAARLRLEDHPAVNVVFSPDRLVTQARAILGQTAEIPESAGQIDALYTLARGGGSPIALVNDDASRARIIARSADLGAAAFVAMEPDLTARVVGALASRVEVHATGETWLANRGLTGVLTDLRDSIGLALVTIAVLIAGVFRSVRIGLLSLVPNLIPIAVGYGALGWLGWLLDPGAAIVFTVAFGIAVDSAIHMLARYDEERIAGLDSDAAIHRSVMQSGRAIAVTSIILGIGFGVNALSSFPGNAVFGVLGALIVLAAMVCNLVVLPALLKVAPIDLPRWRRAA